MTSAALEIDDDELAQLQLDIREAPVRIQAGSKKTMERATKLVDRAMTRDATGHRYLPRFPRNISHEVIDSYTGEVGFDRSRGLQGALVWIILNGSINNAPVWDKWAAIRRSTPAIIDMYGGMVEDATLGSREA